MSVPFPNKDVQLQMIQTRSKQIDRVKLDDLVGLLERTELKGSWKNQTAMRNTLNIGFWVFIRYCCQSRIRNYTAMFAVFILR